MTDEDRVKQARKEAPKSSEIKSLRSMSVSQLREKYRAIFEEDSHSRNKQYLLRRIGYGMQELAHGGLSDRARERVDVLSRTTPVRRLPRPEAKPPQSAPRPAELPPAKQNPRIPPAGTLLSSRSVGRG